VLLVLVLLLLMVTYMTGIAVMCLHVQKLHDSALCLLKRSTATLCSS
jgi:hypothetical protein